MHGRLLLTALAATLASASALAACSSSESARPADAGADGRAVADDASPDGGLAPNVEVQLLALNDFHGNLEPPSGSSGVVLVPIDDPVVGSLGADAGTKLSPDAGQAQIVAGGAAYLGARVKQLRAAQPNTLVVSAGDLIGASPLMSNLFKDEPAVKVMNALGLDFNGVGNHEFDRGLTELVNVSKVATFQFLAANVVSASTNMTVFPPYGVKQVSGAKVGVIGMTLEATPSVTVGSAVAGLTFQKEADTVNALVPKLKAEGVSAIVVLVHQGGFQATTGTVDTCDTLTGDILPIVKALDPAVDVVVSAHTHQAYDCTIDGRLVTSAASFGRVLTKIDLTLDPNQKKVVKKSAKNVPVTRDLTPDPEVASVIATYQAQAAPLANRVVGHVTADVTANARTAASPSCETPLGDVIADGQLDATKDPSTGSAVIAFMNPGGIRTDLVYAPSGTEGAGVVTYGEAFAVQPFANLLVTMTLTGAQIKALLDQQFASGAPRILQTSKGFTYSYTWNPATKAGVVDAATIKLNGAVVAPSSTYRVTVNNFMAGGGDGFAVLTAGTERMTGTVDVDAFVAWLGKKDPLSPPALDRVTGDGCQ